MAKAVLVVDDEIDLATTLKYNLSMEGYVPLVAYDGLSAMQAANEHLPDLILLDLMLPDSLGTEICEQLKTQKKTRQIPIIMLTAKSEESDRVHGFEKGADDYVVKPFSMRELMLRVRAMLRRDVSERQDELFELGDLKIDQGAHEVHVGHHAIALTALEFRLLSRLIKNRGRVQSRQRLLEDVWGIRADVNTRTVDTHIKRLRDKLGSAGRYIETLRGVGYRIIDHGAHP